MKFRCIATLVCKEFYEGEKEDDGPKWNSSVRGADGCIYGIPYCARRVVRFNPIDNSMTEIGPDLGIGGNKWNGGTLAGNGCIYCTPLWSDHILKIDTINGNVTILEVELPETGICKWLSGALAFDQCIYFMPYNARRILRLNPEDDTVASVGHDLGWGSKYKGIVVGKDRCLYGIPRLMIFGIVRFNPVDQSVSGFGQEAGNFGCGDGALGRDGFIYAATDDGQVLRIDVVNSLLHFVGIRVMSDHQSVGWGAAILGNDGCIYWPPYCANQTLKFDPVTQIASLVGDYFGDTFSKWSSGAAAGPDGAIYCIPCNATRVLAIDPFKEFAMKLQAEMEKYPEELGRLFEKDDRGITFYECSITKFGIEKVSKVIQDCIPSSIVCSGSYLQSFVAAAACENSVVSVIYYLLRRNLDSSSLANYCPMNSLPDDAGE
jgi:hypothetical protein